MGAYDVGVDSAGLPILLYPCYAQPKYDGVRCIVPAYGEPYTRQNFKIPNHVLRRKLMNEVPPPPKGYCYDGELHIEGVDTFAAAVGAIRSEQVPIGDEAFAALKYTVFDLMPLGEEQKYVRYEDRLALLTETLQPASTFYESIADHTTVLNSDEALAAYIKAAKDAQAEGVIFRHPDTYYMRTRASNLALARLKFKTDAEGYIIDFKPEVSKFGVERATLGAFIVRSPSFAETFSIGTGFTQEQRKDFWARREELRGQNVTFEYIKAGIVSCPRSPTFKRFRPEGF